MGRIAAFAHHFLEAPLLDHTEQRQTVSKGSNSKTAEQPKRPNTTLAGALGASPVTADEVSRNSEVDGEFCGVGKRHPLDWATRRKLIWNLSAVRKFQHHNASAIGLQCGA